LIKISKLKIAVKTASMRMKKGPEFCSNVVKANSNGVHTEVRHVMSVTIALHVVHEREYGFRRVRSLVVQYRTRFSRDFLSARLSVDKCTFTGMADGRSLPGCSNVPFGLEDLMLGSCADDPFAEPFMRSFADFPPGLENGAIPVRSPNSACAESGVATCLEKGFWASVSVPKPAEAGDDLADLETGLTSLEECRERVSKRIAGALPPRRAASTVVIP
jgi:hypothetical protein